MKTSFPNMISEHGIVIATSTFGLVLSAFWKRARHMRNIVQFEGMHRYVIVYYNYIIIHIIIGIRSFCTFSNWLLLVVCWYV